MTDNKFDLMRESVKEAEHTIRAADIMAADMAEMLVKRLRSVNKNSYHPRLTGHARTEILRKLKRELRNFNSNTGEWK